MGIADECGILNIHLLEKNGQYKKMLREGWEWCIVPAAVDIMFPAFAKIAQQALNISNHIVDGSFGGLWAIYCMKVFCSAFQ